MKYRGLAPETVDPLTVRERQILQLIAEGKSVRRQLEIPANDN
jgi:DNA-binding CsgD family transcriptional regulator